MMCPNSRNTSGAGGCGSCAGPGARRDTSRRSDIRLGILSWHRCGFDLFFGWYALLLDVLLLCVRIKRHTKDSEWGGKINQELREPSFSSQLNSLYNTSLSGSALSALAINAGNPEHVQRICHGCAWLEWQLVAGVVIFPRRDLPLLASSSWDQEWNSLCLPSNRRTKDTRRKDIATVLGNSSTNQSVPVSQQQV